MIKTISVIGRRLKYALEGIRLMLTDSSYVKHCYALVAVVVLGLILGLERMEWIAVIFCCGGVLAAEAFNTAIEILCDRVTTERDESIRKTKDIAAGAVLTVSIVAAIAGMIVFIPAILRFVS